MIDRIRGQGFSGQRERKEDEVRNQAASHQMPQNSKKMRIFALIIIFLVGETITSTVPPTTTGESDLCGEFPCQHGQCMTTGLGAEVSHDNCSVPQAIASWEGYNPLDFTLVFPRHIWVNTQKQWSAEQVTNSSAYTQYCRSEYFQGLEGKTVTALYIYGHENYVFTNDYNVTKYVTSDPADKPYPVVAGFPKLITELLTGFPDNTNVDAAFRHAGGNTIVGFTYGTSYMVYDVSVQSIVLKQDGSFTPLTEIFFLPTDYPIDFGDATVGIFNRFLYIAGQDFYFTPGHDEATRSIQNFGPIQNPPECTESTCVQVMCVCDAGWTGVHCETVTP